jgi:cell fate regulator YaaT (PSP1 superfamily)
MNEVEYLVSYGLAGDFGRFRSVKPLTCRRGERVVVRSHRGLEIGSVLRSATPRHATFLPNTTVGQLLRPLAPEDEQKLDALRERGRRLFERAAELVNALSLPLELIDAEVLLDGDHAALHLLRGNECDVRPFVSTLSREFALHLEIADLSRPKQEEEDHHGCGREGCGSEGSCGSCGTGGGCSSCGSSTPPDVATHFADLREQMERKRVSLC